MTFVFNIFFNYALCIASDPVQSIRPNVWLIHRDLQYSLLYGALGIRGREASAS